MRETDLYPPVKALLERQGYEVKGEVTGCDLVARRGEEPPVIVELKLSFSLPLVLQGVARQGISDTVYLAVPPFPKSTGRRRRQEILGLCRRLGLGLMIVRPAQDVVEVLADPGPYSPRKRPAPAGRLLREFERRVGDPSEGGTARRPIVTAYRQDALRCAGLLARQGPTKASEVARLAGVPAAGTIFLRDVYGWFERVERGVYGLSPRGTRALETWADVVARLDDAI